MTRPFTLTIILVLTGVTIYGQITKSTVDSCTLKLGYADFSCGDYRDEVESDTSEIAKRIVTTFATASQHFKKCFCESKDSSFLKQLPTDSSGYLIEPLFINLISCDGLYSYRQYSHHSRISPRYMNGFPHKVFLISKNNIYYLNSMYNEDTLSVNRILERETPHLLTLYQKADIDAMQSISNRNTYWTYSVIETPFTIYNGSEFYYDNLKRK